MELRMGKNYQKIHYKMQVLEAVLIIILMEIEIEERGTDHKAITMDPRKDNKVVRKEMMMKMMLEDLEKIKI